MEQILSFIISLVVLADFTLLGSSRLVSFVRFAALQGVLMGLVPIVADFNDISFGALFVAAVSIALKGFVFPYFLMKSLRDVNVRNEVQPFVSYPFSVLIGVFFLAFSTRLAPGIIVHFTGLSPLHISAALMTIFTGLFLIIARKSAITQATGYLIFENGIYLLNTGLMKHTPVLVELGMLLDVFVAVFVMGITIYSINREFEHIAVDKLTGLKG